MPSYMYVGKLLCGIHGYVHVSLKDKQTSDHFINGNHLKKKIICATLIEHIDKCPGKEIHVPELSVTYFAFLNEQENHVTHSFLWSKNQIPTHVAII